MQELTFEQVEEVSGGIDLDWGEVWSEVGSGAVGAVTGVYTGAGAAGWLIGAAIRVHPIIAIGAAGIGGAIGGYNSVVSQTATRIKKKTT